MAALLTALTFIAASAPAGPLALVKSLDREVQEVLKSSDATADKLAARADDFIDFGELAKRAMGTEWEKLNRKQQEELSVTMKGLLRASYAQRALKERGNERPAVTWGPEQIQGNEATVETTVTIKKDSAPVSYKLYRADAKTGWRIYDVVTDDVSLVVTYADEFKKHLGKGGYDGLLAALKKRQASLEKQNAESAQKN